MRQFQLYWNAVFKLITSGVIWGLSFTLVRWVLDDFTTSQLLFWRFILAFLLGEMLLYFFDRKTYKKSHGDMKLAITSGIAIGLSLLFQIHGLNFTTATKSGFITTTYVVMIPFIGYLFFKHKLKFIDVVLACLAILGMSLLLDVATQGRSFFKDLNIGDILTIFSAVTAAFQIILVGMNAKKCVSPFRFNNFQIFWSIPTILPFLIYEMQVKNGTLLPEQIGIKSIVGLILLILFVSLFAFYLQISAQKVLPTATASMLCLLEAPFSFFFAALFLQERLSFYQGFGALIILSSAFLSVYFESKASDLAA